MTVFSASIRDILQTRNLGLPVISLPEIPTAIDRAYQNLKCVDEGQAVENLPEAEIEYWVDLARKTTLSGAWGDLSPKALRKIGQCLWHNKKPLLVADEALLMVFLDACEKKIRKKLCKSLIWEYLSNYGEPECDVSSLGAWLGKNVTIWDWSWSDRQSEFSLFTGHEAPFLIADSIICGREKRTTIFEDETLQSGGMDSVAFAAALRQYSKNVGLYDTGEIFTRLKRILEWATLDGQKFSYSKLKTLFINCLLLPWISATPDEKIINLTQGFLLDSFDDPRFEGASWKGVDENAMRVIRGWLVKRALAQFLDVVDELALDHQWKYRRAFWMAYYKKGVISDAWVTFAASGAAKARQIARRNEDNSWLSFGNLSGSGDPDHAVLILRIGNLTVADFSHNGKCRLWGSKNEDAPKPYEKQYERSKLMNTSAESEHIHSNSPGYLWQRRVAAEINNVTGIQLVQKDYMPR